MSGALAMHFSNNYKTPRPGLAAAPAAICQLADVPVDVLRFRPNLVVKSLVEQPFVEGEWVEAVLQIGGARVRVDRRDSRCVVVNLEPLTGEKTARSLSPSAYTTTRLSGSMAASAGAA